MAEVLAAVLDAAEVEGTEVAAADVVTADALAVVAADVDAEVGVAEVGVVDAVPTVVDGEAAELLGVTAAGTSSVADGGTV